MRDLAFGHGEGSAESLKTVAKGVEHGEQHRRLHAPDGTYAHRFSTGRPLPANGFERLFLYL